ncbi:MAG TPA: menaquinone biosynthesis protein [Phycisphaerae bacterium]|nr:menaquinone biosynthesis protein [Phycisphaerae bacterium]
MAEKVTIGTVPYLNARPLTSGLESEGGVELLQRAPSDLGPLLRRGAVDVALVPSIEYFRLAADAPERARSRYGGVAGSSDPAPPNRFVALPVAAIGSRGAVGSVRLFGYVEPEQLRRVLLDPASRTSNALVRILLARRFNVRPHFVLPEAPESPAVAGRPPGAELLIGDRALVAERPGAKWVLDLGEEWDDLVHLPFVYAFWVARADAPLERLIDMLTLARDRGLAAREAMAEEAHRALGLPLASARRYLLSQVRYEFGRKEQDGLRAFHRMAADGGLAPEGGRLRFPPKPACPVGRSGPVPGRDRDSARSKRTAT